MDDILSNCTICTICGKRLSNPKEVKRHGIFWGKVVCCGKAYYFPGLWVKAGEIVPKIKWWVNEFIGKNYIKETEVGSREEAEAFLLKRVQELNDPFGYISKAEAEDTEEAIKLRQHFPIGIRVGDRMEYYFEREKPVRIWLEPVIYGWHQYFLGLRLFG